MDLLILLELKEKIQMISNKLKKLKKYLNLQINKKYENILKT